MIRYRMQFLFGMAINTVVKAGYITLVLVITMLLIGCDPGFDVDVSFVYGYRILGSGSNNIIRYMDCYGVTHTVTDYDFENNSGKWEVNLNRASIGDSLFLDYTNGAGGSSYIDVFGPLDRESSVPVVYIAGELDHAWVSYEIPMSSIVGCPYKYIVLGDGTNAQINWYAGGFNLTTHYDLLANGSIWESPTNLADTETDLSVGAYSGSNAIQVFLDGEQVLHAEGGDSRWCTYTVPILPEES